jgi:hypothetical protein
VSKSDLLVDWATYEAAKYACEHWHYTRCAPKFKQLWIGAWERGRFIGIVSFGRSSTPYLGTAYGLETTECAELTRIALRDHSAPVSRIMAIAIRMVKKQSPGMRLLVSLADGSQGHHGGVYQATNWVYVGKSSTLTQYYFRDKWRNDTSLMRFLKKSPSQKKLLPSRVIEGKHKYLMPLDAEMRHLVIPLSKPYPKRAKEQDSENPSELGGATPTRTLQSSSEAC